MIHIQQLAQYKAAIALNNSAVTLLERECYKDAVDTFRASINLIQTTVNDIMNPSTMKSTNITILERNHINHQLQESWYRCARASGNTKSTRSNTNFTVDKVSSQQDLNVVRDSLMNTSHNTNTKVFHCIVIEPVETNDYHPEAIGVDCNTILYNFGVAHCILAHQLEDNSKLDRALINELRQCAYQIFRSIEPFFFRGLDHPILHFLGNHVVVLSALFAQIMSETANQLHYALVFESYVSISLALLVSINAQLMLIPSDNCHAAGA